MIARRQFLYNTKHVIMNSMKNKIVKIIGSLFLLAFLSCRTTGTLTEENRLYITDEVTINLLAPSTLDKTYVQQQIIHGSHGDDEYTIMAFVEMDGTSLDIAGMTPIGTSLFDLHYDSAGITFSASGLFPEETALYLLGDFQLSYYPGGEVEREIRRAGLDFEEEITAEGWTRRIRDPRGELIIEIIRRGNRLDYHNYLRDYRYEIEEKDIS